MSIWIPDCLSEEEIERMVNEAEKYKEEDDKQQDRIQAKNALESYVFDLKSTVENDEVKGKISDDDKATVVNKTKEILDWLDQNQVSTK